MVILVGINGFGRIGRIVFRTCLESDVIEVSAINDPSISVEYISYLIKFDSTHGKFKGSVSHTKDQVVVNGRPIRVFQEKAPSAIPWDQHNVKYVIEASGLFTSLEKASGHLESKSVILVLVTSPSTDIPMLVIGVNEATHLKSTEKKVISCASSTLCCLALIMKLLDDNFGVDQGFVTSIHAMSPSLKPLDGLCTRGRNWRDHRSIHQNIIPGSTGACRALAKIMPQFKDKLKALTFRVPIVNVSVLDLSIRLVKNTSLANIVKYVDRAEHTTMKNLIRASKEDAVSSDFIGDRCSCILDVQSSLQLKPNFYKLVCWYENEYSYACRIIETIIISENFLQYGLLSSMSILRMPGKCASNILSGKLGYDGDGSSSEILQNILFTQSKSFSTSSKVCASDVSKEASVKLDKKSVKYFKANTKDSMSSILDELISEYKANNSKVKLAIEDLDIVTKSNEVTTLLQNIEKNKNVTKTRKTRTETNHHDVLKQLIQPQDKSHTFSAMNLKKTPCSLKSKDSIDVAEGISSTHNRKLSQSCSSASGNLQKSARVRLSVENSSVNLYVTSDTPIRSHNGEETTKLELTRNESSIIKENTKCVCMLNHPNKMTKEINNSEQNNESEHETTKTILNAISSDMYLYFVDEKCNQDDKDNKDHEQNEDKMFNTAADSMAKECLIFGHTPIEAENVKNIVDVVCAEDYLQEPYTSKAGKSRNTTNINKLNNDNLCDKLDSVSITDSENSFIVEGKQSQVLAIADVTVSMDDFQNLEQVCQIIEVSDELSDKLLSKLSHKTDNDGKNLTANWSFKEFCKKINLDDFCQDLFGKIDTNE